MTDPNDLDPADLRALDHLRERLAMPRGDLAAIRAILDRTGDYNGTLPDRVQKLVNDWQTGGRALIRISALVMAGENEPAADAVDRYVSTTRQQIAGWMKVTEAVDTALTPSGTMYDLTVTLADRVVELRRERDNLRTERAQVREMLDGAGITSDTVPAAVAMLIKERAEWRAQTPAAPDVAPVGVVWLGLGLHVNGIYEGEYSGPDTSDGWWAYRGAEIVGPLPNEATARAVLLALAGQECGTVRFGVRPGATWETILAARDSALGWVVDCLLRPETYPPRTADPEIVRAWVAHGQAALTISVPE